MRDDPIVAEVRATREQLAARFGFDVHSIFADLRARQAKLGDRLVRGKQRLTTESAAASDGNTAALRPGR